MHVPPPVAEQRPRSVTLHGETRQDPYAWLRVDNWQEVMRDPTALAPDVRRHLEAENAHAEAFFSAPPDRRASLFEEMKGRIKEDDRTVPEPDGPYAYYSRFETGGQHPVFCRTPRDGGDEEVLLHGDREAQGQAFWQLAAVDPDPGHRILGFAVDRKGSEIYRLHFRSIETGADLPDVIDGTNGNFEWAEDGCTVLYTRLDEHHRPSCVMAHRMGTDPAQDRVVYEESDPGFFVGVSKTESRAFLVVDAHDHVTSEVRLIDAQAPDSAPWVVRPRDPGVEYDVGHRGRHLYIRTNLEAEDFRIVRASIEGEAIGDWEDFVPHRSGRLVTGFHLFAHHLVWMERVDALPRIVVHAFADRTEHAIAFEEEVYSLGLHGSREFDTSTLRFSYSSMATPNRVFDYDLEGRQRVLRKEQEVPSGHDPSHYVVRRTTATAHDGASIPVSILHRRDTPLDGTAPVLLYGYGAYGHSIAASFGTTRFSLVDRGFVYAIAHVRGGTERGYGWYRAGKGDQKSNTFRDFIAAAEHLAGQGYGQAGRIAAQGGSAGGMLMGAIANQRPDLFGAIVAEVPFVDVLNTMSDDTLPLTPPEWPEWGNPREDEAAYRTILAYSPYDNVRAQAYPPMFVTAGLTDPRVTYWEPAKWVARLRAMKTNDAPLLFHTNLEAGHAGASGRFERLKETAMVHDFLLKVLGPEEDV
jgi:oligopeptidase B